MNRQSSLVALQSPLPLHLKILVVDDDEDNRFLLLNFLEVLGCEVLSASSGEETLLLASQQSFDLILLDLVLPGIDGFETFRQLKNDARSRNIPAIAVTGLTLAEERQKIYQAGFDGYLSKPFLLKDLEQLLRHQAQKHPALILE
ncbi:MAG: response regulator [Jaaginema sp. PMC 1079.18]|nr:response regulator [Jaaginema sp. PMC 1080.18]MEC4852533.1 response regulator [Jaaginema sp. PMC 1079.18]MEC4865657.1 response regulator [Jaaginema sp. PMC 1078.18]